jgi:formiminoglutamase
MQKLPVLLSIPHGGTDVPEELINHVCITDKDLFDDMDPFTRQIFDPGPREVEVVSTNIARAFLDMNRATDDLPPENPDGIIKSMTCYKKQIYIKGKEPDEALRKQLVDRYYTPYHRKLRELTSLNRKVILALDCHSMAIEAPPIAPDTGKDKKKRSLICLGNGHGKTCDREMVEKLAACFREAFSMEEQDVTINDPFTGGYITRTYGNKPVPWVQVEMNRVLYLDSPWFDPDALQIDNHRLIELNDMFRRALTLFFGME